jgi:hypothetical protein
MLYNAKRKLCIAKQSLAGDPAPLMPNFPAAMPEIRRLSFAGITLMRSGVRAPGMLS